MKRGLSLYLDLVRFSAAAIVFAEHFRERTKRTFSEFWVSHPFVYTHLFPLSQTAVIVFFVLSGFVIAHVLATRERTPLEYAASRFGRLYSVVVPTLLLMIAVNYFITLRYPHAFDSQGDAVTVFFDYLKTSVFVSNFWLWREFEITGAPFWSLSVEVTFYVGIALLVFIKGRARILSLLLLCLAAGPTAILLAPTWLAGYGAYHLSRQRRLPAPAAAIGWLISLGLLLLCPLIEMQMRQPMPFLRMPDKHVGEILAAYAGASLFALNILAFNDFSDRAEPVLGRVSGLIRWLGSITFALYMFHMSILTFFVVYPIGQRGSNTQLAVMIGGTLLLVATIGYVCERSKGAYKAGFLWVWHKLTRRGFRPVLAEPSPQD
ncbi:MAG TPA: acyltransferase [Rhizomicrobium sp.]|nr:acyltransferase [Rhizomicrobium sp.]